MLLKDECTPIDYHNNDTLCISHSQSGVVQDCPKRWELQYYDKIVGEHVYYKPFSYGGYSHTIMEKLMDLDKSRRAGMINQYIEETGHVFDSYRKSLKDATSTIHELITRYNFKEPSSEINIAIKAPDTWFPVGYKKYLEIDTIDKEFSGLGFRGKIDYFGIDRIDGKTCLIDWKTGKYNKKWSQGYRDQLHTYDYMMHIGGYEFDEKRIEYIEMPIMKKGKLNIDRTQKIPVDHKRGKELIYTKLRDVYKLLILGKEKKKFKKVENDRNCGICSYNAWCRDSTVMPLFYKTLGEFK